jgi:hypothetical protein
VTRREAKRRVCRGAARILESGSDEMWLWEGFSVADAGRMQTAFEELLNELWRRAGELEVTDP